MVEGRRKWTRRALLAGGSAAAALVGGRFALPQWVAPGPVTKVTGLSERAQRLVHTALSGLDLSSVWDIHTHLVGLGVGGTGCFASEDMQSHLHPVQRLQFDMYLSAAGVTDPADADRQFVSRLKELTDAALPEGKALLLAFDKHVRADGEEDLSHSPFFVPNDYAAKIASSSERFGFIASVHPYRTDAIERLQWAIDHGALGVKWLPNAMGIDPLSPRCDAFYKLMAKHQLVLLSHTGEEQAVHAEELQELGNPLRLRRPVERGVRVIAAHSATIGINRDLDAGGTPTKRSFDLFLRMMAEPGLSGGLFGGLSAIVLRNRELSVTAELLKSSDLHGRLANGSDYPVVAVDPVISLSAFLDGGLLDAQDVEPLREIFEANSLLFDLILKRRLRVIDGGERHEFSSRVFETKRLFRQDA